MGYGGETFYDVDESGAGTLRLYHPYPVPAANDVFSADLIDSFFAEYWPQLGLSREQFLALGARRPGDPWELFSMTVLALRLTRKANGVSERHGAICREMWQALYPDLLPEQVPIGSITNGVHARSPGRLR
jgi:starch phosphorylase